MNDILSTFEQFCKKHNKNVVIKEIYHNDGTFELKCTNSEACDDECLCVKRLKYYKTLNIKQK